MRIFWRSRPRSPKAHRKPPAPHTSSRYPKPPVSVQRPLSGFCEPAARMWVIDMTCARPKQLTQEMVQGAGRIITMGCGVDADACPARFMVTEDWGLDDPAGQSIEKIREIRDQIRIRVEALLDELENER